MPENPTLTTNLTGQGGKIVKVKSDESGFEFQSGGAGGGDLVAGNNLSDVANAATSRTNLGLNTTANQTDSADKRFMTDAQETKLDSVASGATQNDTDANLKNRANHTGAQAISTVTNLQTSLDAKADLVGGLIPTAQLPGYVDDVLEYANFAALPGTGTTGKIYVTLDTNITYRWSGSAYVEISASLALGETSSTAYRGDRGKTAYDHSQAAHAPSNATPPETVGTIGVLVNGAAAATPNDTDLVATVESSVLKKITWTSVKAFLKTYFDGFYATITNLALKAAIASPTFTGTITAPTGAVGAAPYNVPAGTLATTPNAGDWEFDGSNHYAAIETGNRGMVPVEQRFSLRAAGALITTIANFFGANSNPKLIASAEYEIEIFLFFTKTTAGTVTWTLTNSAAPTSQNIYFAMSPITGMVAPPGTATELCGEYHDDATAARAFTTGSLTTAVKHYAYFKIFLTNNTGTSLKIQATCSAGSITPGRGSRWICRRMPVSNTGSFAA